MDTKKKFSDRRCSERKSSPRRDYLRLSRSFGISLQDHNGKIINVSTSGVYFEVTTNDTEAFSLGATVPLQIKAVTHLYDGMDEKYLIVGSGKVVRNCMIEDPDHVNRLGVALEFTEKPKTEFDND